MSCTYMFKKKILKQYNEKIKIDISKIKTAIPYINLNSTKLNVTTL